MPQLGKDCSQCGQFKPFSEFDKSGWNKNRTRRVLRADCRPCRRRYMKGRMTMKANLRRRLDKIKELATT
jgi:hypothetical protein